MYNLKCCSLLFPVNRFIHFLLHHITKNMSGDMHLVKPRSICRCSVISLITPLQNKWFQYPFMIVANLNDSFEQVSNSGINCFSQNSETIFNRIEMNLILIHLKIFLFAQRFLKYIFNILGALKFNHVPRCELYKFFFVCCYLDIKPFISFFYLG